MGMAMDTAMERKITKRDACLASILFVTHFSIAAAELEVTPNVEGKVTYTDNVDLSESDKDSGTVTTLAAGIEIKAKGNDGNLSLDYQADQQFYSYDSSKNELFNTLSFNADKGISQTGLKLDVSASIKNISRAIDKQANDDLISGDTIESINAESGVSFQSNKRGLSDFYTRISGAVTDNEDDIGDHDSFSTKVTYKNGQGMKDYFWLMDYSYQTNVGKDDNDRSESHELEEKIGTRPISGFGPFLRLFYEEYKSDGNSDEFTSATWGPGLRYYWHKNSYAELSYDFAIDDDSRDYWRGALFFKPTTRTVLDFDYTRRFYGDAYDFSLSHRNRRVTNIINYTEEIITYDRPNFIGGDDIDELTLSRKFSWETKMALRRTTASLKLSADDQESVRGTSQNRDRQIYGALVSLDYRLSRKTTTSASFNFDSYEFEKENQSNQNDYYRSWSLGLDHKLVNDLSMEIKFDYKSKSSSVSETGYVENRVNFSVRKQL